jgi:pyruvate dehydrogenase (quinone)
MVNPDFVKLAEAMNIKAWEAIIQGCRITYCGLNHKGPAIINIFTDPNALAMPSLKF